MSYTKVAYSNDNECFNGQYNENPDNKEFVKLRNVLSNYYRDYVIADMCDIAASTFSKIKLGYYKPTGVQLTALRYAVKRCGLKANVEEVQQPVDTTTCTRDGDAYVLSPVTQDENIKPITNSEPVVSKQVKTTAGTAGKAIVINVPANFSGSITINVK